jgi:hypothetical protein
LSGILAVLGGYAAEAVKKYRSSGIVLHALHPFCISISWADFPGELDRYSGFFAILYKNTVV